MFDVYRNPDLSDKVSDCMLMVIAMAQSVDRKTFFFCLLVMCFLFVGSSTTTTVHGRAVLDFVSSSGCEQTATEPTYIDRGVVELIVTDVHDLVGIRVGLPIGTSDHRAA